MDLSDAGSAISDPPFRKMRARSACRTKSTYHATHSVRKRPRHRGASYGKCSILNRRACFGCLFCDRGRALGEGGCKPGWKANERSEAIQQGSVSGRGRPGRAKPAQRLRRMAKTSRPTPQPGPARPAVDTTGREGQGYGRRGSSKPKMQPKPCLAHLY